MSAAARTNAAPLPARSAHAAAGDTSPVTSSRRAVRGFLASNARSAIRFIAIAAVRAATTATATSASRQRLEPGVARDEHDRRGRERQREERVGELHHARERGDGAARRGGAPLERGERRGHARASARCRASQENGRSSAPNAETTKSNGSSARAPRSGAASTPGALPGTSAPTCGAPTAGPFQASGRSVAAGICREARGGAGRARRAARARGTRRASRCRPRAGRPRRGAPRAAGASRRCSGSSAGRGPRSRRSAARSATSSSSTSTQWTARWCGARCAATNATAERACGRSERGAPSEVNMRANGAGAARRTGRARRDPRRGGSRRGRRGAASQSVGPCVE